MQENFYLDDGKEGTSEWQVLGSKAYSYVFAMCVYQPIVEVVSSGRCKWSLS